MDGFTSQPNCDYSRIKSLGFYGTEKINRMNSTAAGGNRQIPPM
jgi:hypothetical protein